MSLSVDAPDPPELNVARDVSEYDDVDGGGTEYRRAELEAYLRDGAWEQAFDDWAAYTDLTETEYAVVDDLDLLREYDFFWDDVVGRVGYHTPGIPEDWSERDLHPDLESWETVSTINAELAELGQTVSELLLQEYIEWDTEPDAPEDLPDFE